MQVNTTLNKPSFNPIKLTIVFETQEEIEMFRAMFSFDVSIPAKVYSTDTVKRDALTDLMMKVTEKL